MGMAGIVQVAGCICLTLWERANRELQSVTVLWLAFMVVVVPAARARVKQAVLVVTVVLSRPMTRTDVLGR